MAKIKGNKKNNKLKGTKQADKILGLDGNDKLKGKDGDDKLIGGGGDDELDGGAGDDVMKGGGGDDFMVAGLGNDFFVGGAGIDTVSFAGAATGISIELLLMTTTFDGLQDGFSGIENIDGTEFADSIEGDGAANHFRGFGGKDHLVGGAANDILEGGEGNDVLEGGAGADQLIGGNGFDFVDYSNEKSAVNVYLFGAANTGAATGDTFQSIEMVEGTIFGDVIQGDAAANYLYGLSGSDTMTGKDGNDVIDGGDGADLLDGGAHNDLIYAADETATASDIISGGSGTDTVDYRGASAGVIVDLEANASGGAADGDTFQGVENVNGYYYNDTLRPKAGGSAFGDRGQDTILDVNGTTEILRGGRDADSLFDSDAVRDIFVLENYGDASFDAINNFDAGGGAAKDLFWLPKNMFPGLVANAQGILNADYFAAGTADEAHAQIVVSGTDIIFDANGTGSGGAVKIGALAASTGTLSNLDFALVNI